MTFLIVTAVFLRKFYSVTKSTMMRMAGNLMPANFVIPVLHRRLGLPGFPRPAQTTSWLVISALTNLSVVL